MDEILPIVVPGESHGTTVRAGDDHACDVIWDCIKPDVTTEYVPAVKYCRVSGSHEELGIISWLHRVWRKLRG